MQFAFCIYKYFPYGGIQRDGLRIAQALIQRGHRVRWYALSWEGEPPGDAEFVKVPVSGLSRHALYDRYQKWVARHLAQQPVDLVFGLNKMEGLHAYFAGDSCYEEKARTQRGWWYRRTPRYKFFAGTEEAVFRRLGATEILTISDVQTPLFQAYYRTPAERLHPLPPGIDRSRIAPDNAADIGQQLRVDLGIEPEERILLFVGSGFRKKGLDRVLLALHALPSRLLATSWLLILGADNSAPFVRMSKHLGIASRVRFLGGRDDVPSFFFAADLLLLPAYDENTGTVILESLVAGLPVVTTANCGYAPYVADVAGGEVLPEPFQQSLLDETLSRLLQGNELPVMASNGKTLSEQNRIFELVPTAADLLEQFAERKRLGTLAFCLFEYFPFGGLQRNFIRIATLCAEHGFAIRVYVLSWEGAVPPEFDVVIVPSVGTADHVSLRNYQRWVRNDLARSPVKCVVGFNKMPGLDVYFAADSCYEHKARSLHSWFYRATPRYRHFVRNERAVFAAPSSTEILLLTKTQQEQFLRYYKTDAVRLKLLPPGVPRDRYNRSMDVAEREQQRIKERRWIDDEFSIDPQHLLLIAIGSGFATKGLDRSLQAIAGLSDAMRSNVSLLVIGQDDPSQFRKLAGKLGVAGAVQFLGGREDVPRFLRGADLLLHPAYMETGGIVLLEALVNGLPVLATEICGYADYIERAAAGILLKCEPFRQTELDAALQLALGDRGLRARWREQAMRFAGNLAGTHADGSGADFFDLPQRAAGYIVSAALAGGRV